jgi:putative redox protein
VSIWVLCDRPKTKDGEDAGAMGGELFLIGLGGCFMSNFLAAVKTRDLTLKDLQITIKAQLDGTPPTFFKK